MSSWVKGRNKFGLKQWRSLKISTGGWKVPDLKKFLSRCFEVICSGQTSVIRFGSGRIKH
ncbi:hypothetical protein Hanom_Chr09g00835491 [Helianthus anomalus]